MAESLVSIVIADNRVSAVTFSAEKRELTIDVGDTAGFEKNSDFSQGVRTVLENCGVSSRACRVALGPEFLFFRSIQLPFTDKKQIASIVPFEIQDNVSLREDEYIFDYLFADSRGGGTRILAVILKKEIIHNLLTVLGSYNLDPEIITISGIPSWHNVYRLSDNQFDSGYLLSVGTSHAAVHLMNRGTISLIRSIPVDPGRKADFHLDGDNATLAARSPEHVDSLLRDLCRNVQNTIVALRGEMSERLDFPWYISGLLGSDPEISRKIRRNLNLSDSFEGNRPYSGIEGADDFLALWPAGLFDDVLALASCPNRDLQQINFRKDEFARRYDRKRLRKIVRAAVAVVLIGSVLAVSGLFLDYQRMKNERDRLAAEVAGIYKETLPGSSRIVNPVQQLQVKVNELKNVTSTGVSDDPTLNTLVLLSDISDRIPESFKVTFQRYIYDRRTIRIKGVTDNFNTVDQMKRSLDKSPYFSEVSIVSANVAAKEDGVRFELKLEM
ncbi:MAG: PilN domain-containing protein [Desulfocapsaceae bacterium]|jgi:Tfp pilus assembly protein PilN|nr:PilN domain-containing protein [Desulfocapsaceae bacterium]